MAVGNIQYKLKLKLKAWLDPRRHSLVLTTSSHLQHTLRQRIENHQTWLHPRRFPCAHSSTGTRPRTPPRTPLWTRRNLEGPGMQRSTMPSQVHSTPTPTTREATVELTPRRQDICHGIHPQARDSCIHARYGFLVHQRPSARDRALSQQECSDETCRVRHLLRA